MDNLLDNEMQGEILALNQASRNYLLETTKWARFLAIIGFVFIGLMAVGIIVAAFFSSSVIGMFPTGGGIFFLVYLIVMSLVYVFPILFLYRFANHTKLAVKGNDMQHLNTGLKNLKSLYKFMGIFMIVVLVIYALIFLFGGIAGLASVTG